MALTPDEQAAHDAGWATPEGTDLISGGDDAIRQNAVKAHSERLLRHESTLTVNTIIDDLPSGSYSIWSGTVAESLGMPERLMTHLEIRRWGRDAGVMRAETVADPPHTYMSARLSGGWTDWERTDAGVIDLGALGSGGATAGSSSAMKTVPLAVTLGNGGGNTAETSGTVRFPLSYNAPITRFRVHVVDGNPRYGIRRNTSFRIRALRVGGRNGTDISDGVTVMSNATKTSDSNDPLTSPWVTGSLSGETFLQIAYDQMSAAPISLVGGCYFNPDSAAGEQDSGTGFTLRNSAPFDIWIEAETAAGTPVIGVVGDSNSAGVGTTLPVLESWLSQYCRRVGALPVHYAHSGDSMGSTATQDTENEKWTRWEHLTRPDAVIFALGANDLGNQATYQDMVSRYASTTKIAQRFVSPVLHAITLKPRNEPQGTFEEVRKPYNTWLESTPSPARDVHDMVSPVSSDDETINSEYNADGTHMNTAGHAALAAAITRPITSGSAAETDLGALLVNTGVRNIGTDIPGVVSGSFTVSRAARAVTLNMVNVRLSEDAYGYIFNLPDGFRPPHTVAWCNNDEMRPVGPRIFISSDGSMNFIGMPTDVRLDSTFTFSTLQGPPDPSNYPGIPA